MAEKNNIRQEPAIQKLLSRMPNEITESFTDEQLMHLKLALGARKWGKHKVDYRGTFFIPFVSTRLYYVFLLGRNYRELSRNEKAISAFGATLLTSLFILFSTLFGLLMLYLVKSALGINVLENFSLGIWAWFKGIWA